VIELIPGGSKIRVTNDTKRKYLDALAQYRLASSIRSEVEYFLRGLNELIPDNLLGIFDENELEVFFTKINNNILISSCTKKVIFFSYFYVELDNIVTLISELIISPMAVHPSS